MGHALNGSVQDALIRLQAHAGPQRAVAAGTDHAGIATQTVVERQLAARGLTREEIGPRGVRRPGVGVARERPAP